MRYFGSHWEEMSSEAKNGMDPTHPREAVKDVDIVARIEIVDGTLTVDFKRV